MDAAESRSDRPKHIVFEFTGLELTFKAALDWDFNPEMCELLVRNLPASTIYSHTMSSGQGCYAPMKVVGSTAARRRLLSEIPKGTITFNIENYKTLSFFYGRITEPLPTTPVAHVVPEDMASLERAGREVWFSNYVTHAPVIARVSVKP